MKDDAKTVFGCAAVTLAVVLMTGWPMQVSAIDPAESEKPVIAQPVLKVQDCEITLEGLRAAYQPGETPKIELKAVNHGKTAANIPVAISIMLGAPPEKMSRMAPPFSALWTDKCNLALQAGESKTVPLVCDVKLRSGSGNVIVSAGTVALSLGAFTVPGGHVPSEKLIRPALPLKAVPQPAK